MKGRGGNDDRSLGDPLECVVGRRTTKETEMQKQVAEVALSTAMMLYEQRIAEQEMRVRNLEAELYTAQVCLDNSKRVRMEFARFVERNDKRAPPNT